jgi:hypothetical protein
LMLAWKSGISIQKYATSEQMERLGRLTGNHDAAATAPPPSHALAHVPRRRGKPNKAKKAKGAKSEHAWWQTQGLLCALSTASTEHHCN